ncbi:G patch domain-containing protein 11 [Nymphaea thermarum]|nr:G patch domain-containing protein 11 [Nymphaea thermarum]
MTDGIPSTSGAIGSSNVGFQLLKKCGWKEGTGLGVLEQGRLEPVEAYVKNNKRGLGAEESHQTKLGSSEGSDHGEKREKHLDCQKKRKGLTKRMRKMLEEDKRAAEVEFAREFFRQFWPDNV